MSYVLGEVGVVALGVFAHKLQEGKAADTFDDEEVDKSVIQPCLGDGVEAAAPHADHIHARVDAKL